MAIVRSDWTNQSESRASKLDDKLQSFIKADADRNGSIKVSSGQCFYTHPYF
jgi:hypothetical protein